MVVILAVLLMWCTIYPKIVYAKEASFSVICRQESTEVESAKYKLVQS